MLAAAEVQEQRETHAPIASMSQVVATVRPLGQQVVPPERNPCGPSFRLSAGIPSRLFVGVLPT